MANYTSTHTGATIDASVTIISGSGVTQSDLIKLNAVTSTAVELNLLDGVTATTAELNILDGVTATATELNYLDGADSSITTLSLPDNTTITTFGASLIDDANAAAARTTLGVDAAGTDNSTDVTLVTTSHDYLSISGQAITLGSIDISDDTNLVGGDGLALTGDTLSVNVDDSSLEINSDTLRVKASGVTNAMLANSSVSYGGVSVALGASDATPSFDLSDATSLPIVAGTTGTLSVARGGTGATTASGARTNLNVDVAGTDNSTDVTLVTTFHDYLSLSGQAITLGTIDIGDDTNLVGGTGITLTGDTLSTTDSEIVHDNLSGFVANEHIDHSGVSITAGAGLTGGGDITATRDIAVGAGTGVTVNADDIAIGQDVATTADVTFNSVTSDDFIGSLNGAVQFQAKATVALNKGDAVYVVGISGNTPTIALADANDATKMPSFGLAASSASIDDVIEVVTFGTLTNINTSAFSQGDVLFISSNGTSGNTLTATKEAGESVLCQNIGKVIRSHATVGSIKVGGAGRANATPNLNDGNIFIGNGSNQPVTASLNTKIEDYLDGGTSTANFDTISVDGAEITSTPAELNVLDGITSTTAELNYTDGVTSNIQTQLDAKAPLASPAFTGTATGANLTLSGDLTVNGSTTTLDTTNLAVEDNLMELNAGVTSNANDSGFLIERGSTGDNAIFMWDESADKFTLGTTTATGTTTGDITLSSTGTLVANVEGNVTGAVTGNADTATTLATARNFSLIGDVTAGAVSFDGSGNVALSTTIAANSVALGTDTTGNYMSDLTEGTGIDITHTPAEGSNATITLDLTEVGFGGGANRLITDDGDGTVTAEANLTYSSLTLQIPSADGKVSVDKIEGYSNNTNSLFLNDDQTAANNMVSLQSINHINIMTDGNNNGVGDFRVYNGSYDIDTADLVFKVDSSGVLTSTDSSESMEYTPSNNYLTIHETGATKGSHLRLATDNSDFILSAGGSANQLSLYDVNGTANRLVVNSSGLFQFLNGISVSGDATFDTDTLKVDSANNRVGIGTNSPGTKLEVKADGDTSQEVIKIRNSSGTEIMTIAAIDANGDGYINFNSSPGTINTNGGDLVLSPGGSGNVGIGTTSPAVDLHILDTGGHSQLRIETDNVGSGAYLELESTTNKYQIYNVGGDLGIDESGVATRLTIKDSTGHIELPNDNQYLKFGAGGDGVIYSLNDDFYISNFTAGQDTIFQNLNSAGSAYVTNLFIDGSAERVGIGTASPESKLMIVDSGETIIKLYASTASTRSGIWFTNGSYSYGTNIGTDNKFHITGNINSEGELVTVDSSGNVGIGTSSPGYKLDVSGNARFTSDLRNEGRLLNSVGSSASPSYSFFSQGNAGMYRSGDGVGFSAAGSSVFDINSTRMYINTNVGIGTSSPTQDLHLHRTGVGDDVYIQFTNGDTGSTSGDGLQIGLAGNEDARIIQKENSPLEFWTNNTLRASFEADGDFVPNGDGVYDLGASANRWAVVYSADLDLSNEGSQNDVDGTWGSYVIQEGEEDLFLINRRNGKKYKFMLQEVQD